MSRHRFQNDAVSFFPSLPSGWREERIHDVVELRTSSVDKKSEEGEKPVRLCNYVDVYKNDKITMALDFMESTATDAQIDRFGLRVGDVVITKDSETPDDIGVPALIAETAPDLVCGYHLTILRPNEREVSGSYLFYAVASRLSAYQFYLGANGVTRFGLTYQGTKNLRIPIPSIPEQQQIAVFLDWKTAQIDGLVARNNELLEKLKEMRLAVITQAVTRGLNSVVPMRDTGIPWLGQVPQHWAVKKFSYFSRVVRGASPRPAGDPTYFNGDYIPWITVGEITKDELLYLESTDTMLTQEGAQNSRTMIAGTLVITNSGATLGVPKILSITGCANDGVVAFEDLAENADKVFLYFFLRSQTEELRERMKQGGGQPNLNTDIIKALSVPFPPLNEQVQIAKHLRAATAKLDKMKEKVTEAIDRLTEYRAALITAATTGKVDVRNVTIPLQLSV